MALIHGRCITRNIRSFYSSTKHMVRLAELDRYIADIEAKKQEYSIVDRKELPGDRIMIRIHRQYNKSPFPATEGGEK